MNPILLRHAIPPVVLGDIEKYASSGRTINFMGWCCSCKTFLTRKMSCSRKNLGIYRFLRLKAFKPSDKGMENLPYPILEQGTARDKAAELVP